MHGVGQRSIDAVSASSYRATAAGSRAFSRCSWSALRSMPSAAGFSSTRAARRVPGMGAMSCPQEDPGERGLRRGGADLAHPADEREVAVEVLAHEARVRLPPVVVREVVDGPGPPGEQAVAERGAGGEADPELAEQGQDPALDVTGPERVLHLQRGHRLNAVGAADGVGSGFGEAEMQDLALCDEGPSSSPSRFGPPAIAQSALHWRGRRRAAGSREQRTGVDRAQSS